MSQLKVDADSRSSSGEDFFVVGIGASAGGISALREFFAHVPADSGMAYVVILHLSPQHESNLAAVLQSRTRVPITQVNEAVQIKPNHVYVIPPIKYLVMMDGMIRLAEPERARGGHTSIDLFFRTMAEAYRRNAVAILMSGTGTDGTLGLGRIKEEGGYTIAQQPEEAEYPEMPRAAIETALVDMVLPVAEMPAKLQSLRDGARRMEVSEPAEETDWELDEEALQEVLELLRQRTTHAFNHYKRPTLLRRIARRMQVHDLSDLRSYLALVRDRPEEIVALMRDFLITVTNFFRDEHAFEVLEKEVVPKIFANKGIEDQVRIWSAGCASGEETYSLAILMAEHASRLHDPPRIQIFASDVDERAIAKARDCLYPETIALDVGAERLRRFFTKEGDRYRVSKELREMVLFAPHNVLRDPPFSRLDLISCRNLMIYLNKQMQERLFEIFHFALKADAFLFLGTSESAETVHSLFASVDKKARIYVRRSYVGLPLPSNMHRSQLLVHAPESMVAPANDTISAAKLHHQVLEEVGPASVLINEDYDVVHLSEHAGEYLRFAGGEPTRNLLKLVDPALGLELRSALFEARGLPAGSAARVRHVLLDSAEPKAVNLIVHPIREVPEAARGYFLVIFDEDVPALSAGDQTQHSDGLAVVRQLEQELQNTRDHLRLTVEQYETSTEELRASNEELQAINEELRSTTEELETSKEELQSVNEELTTVNQEYREKIDEVGRANSDLQNLMSSTDIATIFLDRTFQIKRYTPRAQQLFNITSSDVGRPLDHFTNKLDYSSLSADAEEVLRSLQPMEREVLSSDNKWFLARLAPYRTVDDRIDGVVLNFVDITSRVTIENQLRTQKTILQEQSEVLNFAPVMVLDRERRILQWSHGCELLYGYQSRDALGKISQDLLQTEFPIPREKIDSVLAANRKWEGELVHTTASGVRIVVACQSILYRRSEGRSEVIFEVDNDITARRLAEDAVLDASRNKDEFLAMLGHELRNPLGAMLTSVEILRRAQMDAGSQTARGVIERQLRLLMRLVDDLLDVERLARGKIALNRRPIELSAAIDAALESCRPLIDKTRHELKLNLAKDPIAINGDLARLSQVVANLLDNALKFTPPGGKIELSTSTQGDRAIIRVRDSGVGIDRALLGSVFETYTQGESAVNEAKGLGLGLNLVRRLVEMHGGRVSVTSEGLNKGSEFTVSLPLADRKLAAVEKSAPFAEGKSSTASRRRKVLIIEDNRDAADSLEELLKSDGHDARCSYDGASALEIAKEFKPEIVIVDIGLPVLSGFEVAARMRELVPDVKIIALSGWRIDPTDERAARFDHCFTKPLAIDDLYALLARI